MEHEKVLVIYDKTFENVYFISKENNNLELYAQDNYLKNIIKEYLHNPINKKVGGIDNDTCYDGFEKVEVENPDFMTCLYETMRQASFISNKFNIKFLEEVYREYIDTVIKRVWSNNIKDDYQDYHLLYEDSLKNSLYFYLRNEFSCLMKCTNIRIYPEYQTYRNENLRNRIDIAIVEVKNFDDTKHLGDNDIEILSAIEIKYVKHYKGDDDAVYSDVKKCLNYLDELKGNPQVYLTVIQEAIYDSNDFSFLADRKIELRERITELLAYIPLRNKKSKDMQFIVR